MTVQELIEMLQEVEDKSLPIELCIGGIATDWMWLDLVNGKYYLGTT